MSYHIGTTNLSGAFPIMDGDVLVGYFNQAGNDTSEGVANAKLFAAAPDLLAACQKAIEWMEWMNKRGYRRFDFAAEYDALQAAIAKAAQTQTTATQQE